MTYKEYIDLGIKAINMLLEGSNYSYDSFDYNDKEGRLNSIKGEDDFLGDLIKDNKLLPISETDSYYIYSNSNYVNLKLIIPKSARSWFDFGIVSDNSFFPINIKISNGTNFDNLFGVKVLDYLLFGNYEIDEFGIHYISQRNEENVAMNIKTTLGENGIDINNELYNNHKIRDYFFLSINKGNGSIKINPFFNLERDVVKTNPKNGFQVNFNTLENPISDDLNFNSNILKLIDIYFEYIEKKAKPYIILTGNE